jgi:hypothetical protein
MTVRAIWRAVVSELAALAELATLAELTSLAELAPLAVSIHSVSARSGSGLRCTKPNARA